MKATGTAEDLASRVAKEAGASLGVHTLVCDLEEYDPMELLQLPSVDDEGSGKWLVGFFLATYGEGEPTDNAIDFYEWIMDGRGKGDDEEVEVEDEMTEEKAGKNVRFTMFGLGNKTYEHFNAISRRTTRRLKAIGAEIVGEPGEGDDDGSLEDDFLAWKPKLFEALAAFFDVTASSGRENPHVPLFNLAPADADEAELFHGEVSADNKPRRWKREVNAADVTEGGDKYSEISTKKRITYNVKNPYLSRVGHSRQLFFSTYDEYPTGKGVLVPSRKEYVAASAGVRIERHCVHMEFDLEGSGLRYETGDHCGILAKNRDEEVAALAKALGMSDADLDKAFTLEPNSSNPQASTAKVPFPVPCSYRTALTYYLAITPALKQHQLEILGKYATSDNERDTLYALVDNKDLFVKSIETPQKNLAEVLTIFKSVKIPVSVILAELLPRIAPRFYSISSSSKKDPTKVSVTAVVVRYVLPTDDPLDPTRAVTLAFKEGLATSMIDRLHDESVAHTRAVNGVHSEDTVGGPLPPLHVPIFIRGSSFRLPRDMSVPIVMIGPGTGVAPFRGFVAERMHLSENNKNPAKRVGPTWLFYGCRHPDQDHLYADEFAAMQEKNKSWEAEGDAKAFDLRFFNAFSRAGEKKVYVQHLLKEQGEAVWALLNEKRGYFYVCGDAKNMASDVQAELLRIAKTLGGKTDDAAKAWLKNLKSSQRYQED
ncbi:NADPH-cytochrome P450 reductase, partial [Irineochytrium annulatum]